MKERYKLTIEPLTPVHIGTGVELTPLDYKVTSKLGTTDFKKNMYFKFSSDKILKRMIESGDSQKLAKFEEASVKGNMKELQSFFQQNLTCVDDLDYPCEVTNGFVKRYSENQGKDPYDNASKVYQMYRPEGLKTSVIPGSSIKGAIRTGILNAILSGMKKNNNDKIIELKKSFSQLKNEFEKKSFETKLQKALLGSYSDAKNDPFRAVQISDSFSKSSSFDNQQIVGLLKNVSYDESNEKLKAIEKLQIQAECISGTLTDSKTVLEGVISIDDDLFSAKQISKKITMKEVIKSCNHFFFDEFCNEGRRFYPKETGDTKLIDSLFEELSKITDCDNSFIIRVGRWSQVEFVTFGSDFRNPKTPRGKDGKPKGWGGTRTLFDYNGQYLPMGWCKCTIEKLP